MDKSDVQWFLKNKYVQLLQSYLHKLSDSRVFWFVFLFPQALKPVFFLGLCWDPRVQLRVSQESRRSQSRNMTRKAKKKAAATRNQDPLLQYCTHCCMERPSTLLFDAACNDLQRWTGSFFSSGSACTDDQTFLPKMNNWDSKNMPIIS